MAQTTRASVGVIGLGIMGSAMSANLMRGGYRVIGYDVAAKPRLNHRRAGGLVAASCGAVAGQTEVIICSLPSAEALLQTAAGQLQGPIEFLSEEEGKRATATNRGTVERPWELWKARAMGNSHS